MSRVSPAPPRAGEELAHVGAGLRFIDAPTDYFSELRTRHGDTFLVDLFGFELLVTFSARGLESLYALPEDQASFGLATLDLIGFKTPTEILRDADTTLFRELLANARMPGMLAQIDAVAVEEFERWGASGEIDLFDAIRTLEQRIGLALWIAPCAARDPFWRPLKEQLDVLDQAESFVAPERTLETIRSGKAAERQALARIGELLPEVLAAHDAGAERGQAAADLLRARFATHPPEVAARKLLHNAINLNQGFLSNLYAAIGWVVARLLLHAEVQERFVAEAAAVRAAHGADFRRSSEALAQMGYCEQVLMESVRLAQRSLTLRKVLAPLDFDAGDAIYRVEPGVYIATLLSVTNAQTAELMRFDPEHYRGREIRPELLQFGKASVSTFGHGRHACPAQRFSVQMCRVVVSALFERFALRPLFEDAQPSRRQMGGVSRPQAPLFVAYRRRG